MRRAARRARVTRLAFTLGLASASPALGQPQPVSVEPPVVAETAAPLRSRTAGPAAALEVGRYGSGLGVALAYYQPVPLGRLSVGAGVNAGIRSQEPGGPAAGVNGFAAYGVQHRALLLVGYALTDRRRLRLHGVDAAERSLWGGELAAGYELVSDGGTTARALVGTRYVPDQAMTFGDRFYRSVTLSLGWKLW